LPPIAHDRDIRLVPQVLVSHATLFRQGTTALDVDLGQQWPTSREYYHVLVAVLGDGLNLGDSVDGSVFLSPRCCSENEFSFLKCNLVVAAGRRHISTSSGASN
jgi:hypothetical protein